MIFPLAHGMCKCLLARDRFELNPISIMPNSIAKTPFDPFASHEWHLAHGRSLALGPTGVLMGIVNVTPDSFSDGGRYLAIDDAIKRAKRMVKDGASVIDIGGESSRPGAEEISAQEEMTRVLPVIEELAKTDIVLSIDTWRAETAKKAIPVGAHIINDIWGLRRDPDLAKTIAAHKAGSVIMHTGRERKKLADPIKDQFEYFTASIELALKAGIARQNIVLDPGYGFAKDTQENLTLLSRSEELLTLGYPILTGTSRKRFIGAVTGRSASRRDTGTAATSLYARMKGSAIIRVHDIAKNRDAVRMADAILKAEGSIVPSSDSGKGHLQYGKL